MGTSLSGLTPATTFDGLLKVGDNDPLTADLKAISTGDGTDTILSLSNSALQIGGATTIVSDNTGSDNLFEITQSGNNNNNSFAIYNSNTVTTPVYQVGYQGGLQSRIQFYSNITFRPGGVSISEMTTNEVRIGGGSGARLAVKGSGATSATASLLVQNSAGTNVIKANDDGRVLLGAGTSYQNHLLELNGQGLGSTQTLLRLQSSVNFDGAYTGIGFTNSTNGASLSSEIRAYRESYGNAIALHFAQGIGEVLRATSEGKFGIGETTPTARLHVKGSGNDATTTSLLVEKSDATQLLKIRDDGNIFFGPGSNNYLQNGYNLFGNYNAIGSWNIGTASAMGARVGIKGTGATSATTALLVQNSAGTDLLEVLDDGQLAIKSNSGTVRTTSGTNIFSYSSGGGGVLDVNPSNGNSVKFRARGDNDTYLIETNPANDAVGIGLTGATAKLHVKGSGATSATTALLVENSAGTDLLKVNDAGEVSATTFYAGASIVRQNQFRINQQWLSSGTGGLGIRIGTNVAGPHDSAKLEVDSTTQGFLPPRMTTTQRDAISSPASGLMVYNTTTNKAQCYNGTAWQDLF